MTNSSLEIKNVRGLRPNAPVREIRVLRDLHGVGPSIESNLHRLGVMNVPMLALREGDELYEQLCEVTGTRQDPCVLDTFRCAVAQARDAKLPREQCDWWWWSRQRKHSR